MRLTWSLTPHSPAARLARRRRRPAGVTASGPYGASVARIPSSPPAPEDRGLGGQGLLLSRTMLSNHKLPYVGRFACDWPRLATTDPHAAHAQCRGAEAGAPVRWASMTGRADWVKAYADAATRPGVGTTMSGIPVAPAYGPDDGLFPGQFPYTRGPYASMYRSRLWTMRMFAGFGTAEDTNARFQEILRSGGDGLSTAFDLPTLMGRDSDDPAAPGEVGQAGVAVDTLADFEDLFAGIDLAAVTTSMTINSPAPIVLAMYVAVAEKTGHPPRRPGRHAAERHLEGVPGPEGVRLPAPAVGAPGHRRHPVLRGRDAPVVPGVGVGLPHPRGRVDRRPGAGLHPGQRFRLRRGGHRRRPGGRRLRAPPAASSSTPTSTSSRRSPSTGRPGGSGPGGCATATGPRHERSLQLRFHTQTAGVSLTAQQPEVNIARVAIEALAGVLGGTQSLHTDAFDEALALPTEKAARIALRTQQVIAYETGVA